MPPPPTRVIKLGGSLLGLADLPARLAAFLARDRSARPVVVPGGGAAVDLLRRWDRDFGVGEETSHYLALRQLSIHARLLERLGNGLEYAGTIDDLPASWSRGRIPVLDAYRFVREVDERSPDPMPRAWRVTSDSIAARLATVLGANDVVLLKSAVVADGTTAEEAASRGFVDPHFPLVARGLRRVRVVNLRTDPPSEAMLRCAVDDDGVDGSRNVDNSAARS